MPFFHFSQNNSGGVFVLTDTLTHHVVIEADSAEGANAKLESLGGYFNGCDAGLDCDCCGDRWYRTYNDEGDAEPMVYGEPVSSDLGIIGGLMPEGKNAVVHYADGRIEWH